MGFPRHMSWSIFVFNGLRCELVVHCFDVGRIVDHHCLNFLIAASRHLCRLVYKLLFPEDAMDCGSVVCILRVLSVVNMYILTVICTCTYIMYVSCSDAIHFRVVIS